MEETMTNQQAIDHNIVGYLYESRITSGVGQGGSWDTHLRDSHPDSIANIEYRNLLRLRPRKEDEGNIDPKGFKYDLGEPEEDATEHLIRHDIRGKDRNDVNNVVPLVPIEEDRGNGPEPEPIRKKGHAQYFKHKNKDAYYRVDKLEDTAEKIEEGQKAGDIEDTRVYDVWALDQADRLELVGYSKTPFSDPKF